MDIKVNAQDWAGLTSEQQKRVTDILKGAGLLVDGDISPDATLERVVVPQNIFDDIKKGVCTAACTAAEGVAAGACSGLAPAAFALCVAAAHVGGDACRNAC